MTNNKTVLELKQISQAYGHQLVVKDLSLTHEVKSAVCSARVAVAKRQY